jgi:hypothetical protein
MRILEGLITKTTDKSHSGRIYPQEIFDREYRLTIKKMRASTRISKIMNLFIK